MKRFLELFRKPATANEAKPEPRQPDFFCLYCNSKFPHEDLERVLAHLKPHTSKEDAEKNLVERPVRSA